MEDAIFLHIWPDDEEHANFLCLSVQGPEDPEETVTDNAATEPAAPASTSEVGRVMTEDEYEDWKKEREGGKQDDQDVGIDWGMGKIKLWFDKGKNVCKLTCY